MPEAGCITFVLLTLNSSVLSASPTNSNLHLLGRKHQPRLLYSSRPSQSGRRVASSVTQYVRNEKVDYVQAYAVRVEATEGEIEQLFQSELAARNTE